MAVDAQINFRVDEFQFFGHFHNQVGQIVNGGAAVFGFAAAEHQALAVVALLNAAVQIGVLVQRNEKFGKEFRGGFASQPAGFQVFFIKRIEVLVHSAESELVVVGHVEN